MFSHFTSVWHFSHFFHSLRKITFDSNQSRKFYRLEILSLASNANSLYIFFLCFLLFNLANGKRQKTKMGKLSAISFFLYLFLILSQILWFQVRQNWFCSHLRVFLYITKSNSISTSAKPSKQECMRWFGMTRFRYFKYSSTCEYCEMKLTRSRTINISE